MKTFNDAQIGDKVLKIFFKFHHIDGLSNIFRISEITEIRRDPSCSTYDIVYNFWTKEAQFDIEDTYLDNHCIVFGSDTIEIYSMSIFLGIFQFIFRLIPKYILYLLDKWL